MSPQKLDIKGDTTIENCTFNSALDIAIQGGSLTISNCNFHGGYVIPPKWYDLVGWFRVIKNLKQAPPQVTASKIDPNPSKDQEIAALKKQLFEYKKLIE